MAKVFFGGYDSEYDVLEYRGVQMILCVLSVFLYEWLAKSHLWYIALLVGILVYVFWSKGHFVYFKCGTESMEYIEAEFQKGRRPIFFKQVNWIGDKLGLKQFSRPWCFIGLFLRYFIFSLPVSVIVGWQFTIGAIAIPFIYNACFWIDFPPCRMAKSPTNWAELISGFVIGWALL